MADGKPISEILQQSERSYRARDYMRTIEILSEGLTRQPSPSETAAICLRLANAYDAIGRYPDALAMLKRALDIDDTMTAAWNNLGVVCRRLGRLEEAREAFERAYRTDPSNADILVSLGSIALKANDPGNALQYLDVALELHPRHAIAHANRAITLCLFGRLEEAEEALALAVMHGFDGAPAIEDRIAELRKVRDRVLHDLSTHVDESDQSTRELSQEAGELLRLFEMREAQLSAELERSPGDPAADVPLREQRDHARAQIDALRERLGLPRRAGGHAPDSSPTAP